MNQNVKRQERAAVSENGKGTRKKLGRKGKRCEVFKSVKKKDFNFRPIDSDQGLKERREKRGKRKNVVKARFLGLWLQTLSNKKVLVDRIFRRGKREDRVVS